MRGQRQVELLLKTSRATAGVKTKQPFTPRAQLCLRCAVVRDVSHLADKPIGRIGRAARRRFGGRRVGHGILIVVRREGCERIFDPLSQRAVLVSVHILLIVLLPAPSLNDLLTQPSGRAQYTTEPTQPMRSTDRFRRTESCSSASTACIAFARISRAYKSTSTQRSVWPQSAMHSATHALKSTLRKCAQDAIHTCCFAACALRDSSPASFGLASTGSTAPAGCGRPRG